MSKSCPNCGAEVEPGWIICMECGEKLDYDPEATASRKPAPPPVKTPTKKKTSKKAPKINVKIEGSKIKYGIISTMLGVFGIFFAAIVLGPYALKYAKKGKKLDADNRLARVGLILGAVDLLIFLGWVFRFLFGIRLW